MFVPGPDGGMDWCHSTRREYGASFGEDRRVAGLAVTDEREGVDPKALVVGEHMGHHREITADDADQMHGHVALLTRCDRRPAVAVAHHRRDSRGLRWRSDADALRT